MFLQEFDFTIHVRPKKKHGKGDFFSRISIETNLKSIDDSLPDAHLFNVDIIPIEYADVIHFFSTGIFLLEYTEKTKTTIGL